MSNSYCVSDEKIEKALLILADARARDRILIIVSLGIQKATSSHNPQKLNIWIISCRVSRSKFPKIP